MSKINSIQHKSSIKENVQSDSSWETKGELLKSMGSHECLCMPHLFIKVQASFKDMHVKTKYKKDVVEMINHTHQENYSSKLTYRREA